MRHRAMPALAVAVGAIALAGCGGSGGYGGSGNSNATATAASSGSGQITVATTGAGAALVDGSGRTLYLFGKDTGPKSTCTGGCAQQWPPATTTGKPKAGSGAKASLLSTSKRSDGTTQLVYNGHPLYRFSGDSTAGDSTGQGLNAFGGTWYVVGAGGAKVTTASQSGSGSGGGYSRGGY